MKDNKYVFHCFFLVNLFSLQKEKEKKNVLCSFKLSGGAQSNHTTRLTGASVAGGQRVVVTTFAEVVLSSVDHNSATNHGMSTNQGQQGIGDVHGGGFTSLGLDVSKITSVPLCVRRTAVVLAKRVVMSSAAGAAVGQVSILVDVESMLSCLEASNLPFHCGGATNDTLFKY